MTKVLYSPRRPNLWPTPKDILQTAFDYTTQDRVRNFIKECLYTKSIDWDKENEVRMVHFIKNDQDFFDIKFKQKDLDAVYFGSRISHHDRRKIENLLQTLYPATTMYNVLKGKYNYALEVCPCN